MLSGVLDAGVAVAVAGQALIASITVPEKVSLLCSSSINPSSLFLRIYVCKRLCLLH